MTSTVHPIGIARRENGVPPPDVPLGDITALDLDFLARNLRLRLKSGKTYNFTETGGGADQLYNFHRDVNKARAARN